MAYKLKLPYKSKGENMSLLPIIYTSVLIFCGFVTTVLLISYIIYKVRGGEQRPATVNLAYQKADHASQTRKLSYSDSKANYSTPKSNTVRSYSKTQYAPNKLKYYKKASSTNPIRTQSTATSAPRIQVINNIKTTPEKKIVVVRKSNNYNNTYASNKILSYYTENESGAFIRA